MKTDKAKTNIEFTVDNSIVIKAGLSRAVSMNGYNSRANYLIRSIKSKAHIQ